MSDTSGSKVLKYLADRRRGGLSIRTSNFYLQAAKQFGNWLVADGRTSENPLAYPQGQNPQTDIRHPRRALTLDELTKLLEIAAKGRKHHNMTGKTRAMLYKLAANTGFRANELASLTWQSFNLSGPTPSVTVLAAYSKRRREDLLPLCGDISRELASWKSEQESKDEAKLFPRFNPNKAADLLKIDLGHAGIEYMDAGGRFADFHALRHSFASILHHSGVSPKVAQSLLRHSTIGLTMDTYTRIGLHDERGLLIHCLHCRVWTAATSAKTRPSR
jgi:integrase